ncbi:MAG: hypothetical protein H6843_17820 [Rhodospirillaceae bacterium]|nr:hypothetical protein [Rhodospirillaceae bacterium]
MGRGIKPPRSPRPACTAILPDLAMDPRAVAVAFAVDGAANVPSGEPAVPQVEDTVSGNGHRVPLPGAA